VLFDSPPVLATADAGILASRMDGVLLVLDTPTTRLEMARKEKESLDNVQARVLGAVLNKEKRGRGGYYYYYYYHSRDSGQRGKKRRRKRCGAD